MSKSNLKANVRNAAEISKAIWPILYWSRWLGNCPLEYNKSAEARENWFRFAKIFSSWNPPPEKLIASHLDAAACFDRSIGFTSVRPESPTHQTTFRSLPTKSYWFLHCVCINAVFIVSIFIFSSWTTLPDFMAKHSGFQLQFARFPDWLYRNGTSSRGDALASPLSGGQKCLLRFLTSKVVHLTIQGYLLFEIFDAWFTTRFSGKFLTFLNDWADFGATGVSRLKLDFAQRCGPELSAFARTMLFWYVLIPSVFLVPLFAIVHTNFMSPESEISKSTLVSVAIVFAVSTQFSTRSVLEDLKVIFSYRMVSTVLQEIRQALQSLRESGTNLEPETALEVMRDCRNLMHQIRRQVLLLQQVQGALQMAELFKTTLVCSCLIFVTMVGYRFFETADDVAFAFLSNSVWIQLAFRLCVKIMNAENIKREEEQLAEEMLTLGNRFPADNLSLQLQVQSTLTMVYQSPLDVCFCGAVRLNKRLLLGFLGQSLTYIIILLQLQTSLGN